MVDFEPRADIGNPDGQIPGTPTANPVDLCPQIDISCQYNNNELYVQGAYGTKFDPVKIRQAFAGRANEISDGNVNILEKGQELIVQEVRDSAGNPGLVLDPDHPDNPTSPKIFFGILADSAIHSPEAIAVSEATLTPEALFQGVQVQPSYVTPETEPQNNILNYSLYALSAIGILSTVVLGAAIANGIRGEIKARRRKTGKSGKPTDNINNKVNSPTTDGPKIEVTPPHTAISSTNLDDETVGYKPYKPVFSSGKMPLNQRVPITRTDADGAAKRWVENDKRKNKNSAR